MDQRTSSSPSHRPSFPSFPTSPSFMISPFADLPVAFVGSFPNPAASLDPPLPEIAFVGRSNVGKSSLLNALTGRRGLAKTSSTPGKTQHVNVFRLPTFYLVDLPGYGFARASKTARVGFRHLLEAYLRHRERLVGVVWLLDVRHDPSEQDREIQDLLAHSGRPTLAVFTKVDKLGRMQLTKQHASVARSLGLARDDVQLVSSQTGLGIAELGESILAAVRGTEQQ